MLVEAAIVSLAGGLLGVALAPAGVSLIAQLTPRGLVEPPASTLDLRLLAFAAALSIATGVAFSLLPALQTSRASLHDSLQQAARSTAGGRSRLTRDTLVVLQVAAALVLLVGAALMLQTLANLRALDLGFRADHLLTMRTTLPRPRYADPGKRLAFYERVIAEVRALPGVEAAAYASYLPFTTIGNTTWVGIDGRPQQPGETRDALYRVATADYLRTLGVRAIEGRVLDDRDRAGAPLVVVVNETFARTYWPNGSPIGARLRFGEPDGPLFTVVGVVKDVRERGYQPMMKPGVYLSFAQTPTTWAVPESLVARTRGRPEDLAAAARQIVQRVDPDQPVSAVRTMDEIVDLDVADRRLQMMLLGVFASLALLLASIGLYGVLSYAVSQRSREFGLRMALGATAESVTRMVIGRGLSLTAAGVAIGVALAWALTRTMQNLLFGVGAGDPPTFAAVAAMLVAIAFAACYVPARRAARVDPIEALREE